MVLQRALRSIETVGETTRRRLTRRALQGAAFAAALCCAGGPVSANVITDWDEKGVSAVPASAEGERIMAMVHLAMFDAVNSITPRYRPYLVLLPTPAETSPEAAAAAAAGTILSRVPTMTPKAAGEMKEAMEAYLKTIPEGNAKANGIALGEAMGTKMLETRLNDGANAPDDYRPKTRPGVYIPTPITVGTTWCTMQPFALTSPSQFRPGPPIALSSPEYAADYNELKEYGGKTSAKRSAQQTETARFWLMVGPPAYQPLARQIVLRKEMNLLDSARFMAVFAAALADAYIAVFDAKYAYEFWRPITAIRNGDTIGNPDVQRDATWQPIDLTPMHPEYPCAHCILSATAAAVIETLIGPFEHEMTMTSATAPGVTHRWTTLAAFKEEVANARIWAGFHYRFSTKVGSEMGNRIGHYVADTMLLPAS
jgi:hypothetical protein